MKLSPLDLSVELLSVHTLITQVWAYPELILRVLCILKSLYCLFGVGSSKLLSLLTTVPLQSRTQVAAASSLCQLQSHRMKANIFNKDCKTL